MRTKWFVGLVVSAMVFVFTLSAILFIFRTHVFDKILEITVLRAGKPIKFGSYTIFIDKIENNKLSGIRITSNIIKLEAKNGEYDYIPKENAIRFRLADGTAQALASKNAKVLNVLSFKQYNMKIRLKELSAK